MNKLPLAKRAQILSMLCEGSSMRSVARVVDVSFNTVEKLLQDAGAACEEFHDRTVRGVRSQRVQCDEIWSFVHAKQKNVSTAKAAPEGAGDVWTWTALDADHKLILSWKVGGRDAEYALELMEDLCDRLANRVQLTTDGHKAYLQAVEDAFGADIDYAMLVKLYGAGPATTDDAAARRYSPAECTGIRNRRRRTPMKPQFQTDALPESRTTGVLFALWCRRAGPPALRPDQCVSSRIARSMPSRLSGNMRPSISARIMPMLIVPSQYFSGTGLSHTAFG